MVKHACVPLTRQTRPAGQLFMRSRHRPISYIPTQLVFTSFSKVPDDHSPQEVETARQPTAVARSNHNAISCRFKVSISFPRLTLFHTVTISPAAALAAGAPSRQKKIGCLCNLHLMAAPVFTLLHMLLLVWLLFRSGLPRPRIFRHMAFRKLSTPPYARSRNRSTVFFLNTRLWRD